jgi:hypothetical protein
MKQIGGWIAKILEAPDDKARTEAAGREVLELAAAYPMFAWEPVLR